MVTNGTWYIHNPFPTTSFNFTNFGGIWTEPQYVYNYATITYMYGQQPKQKKSPLKYKDLMKRIKENEENEQL